MNNIDEQTRQAPDIINDDIRDQNEINLEMEMNEQDNVNIDKSDT